VRNIGARSRADPHQDHFAEARLPWRDIGRPVANGTTVYREQFDRCCRVIFSRTPHLYRNPFTTDPLDSAVSVPNSWDGNHLSGPKSWRLSSLNRCREPRRHRAAGELLPLCERSVIAMGVADRDEVVTGSAG